MFWLVFGLWGCGEGGLLVPAGYDVAVDTTGVTSGTEIPVVPLVDVEINVVDPLQGEVSWSAEGPRMGRPKPRPNGHPSFGP